MSKQLQQKMIKVAAPIEEAILMCDTREDFLMLAAMMQVSLREIYDTHIGIEGRKEMFMMESKPK